MQLNLLLKFIDWTKRKLEHNFSDTKKVVYFREKELWWAALGKNIGYEVDGKHRLFERPVLILKKYSKDMCFICTLTTQIKNPLPWYQILVKTGKEYSAINISQGRTIARERLLRKISVITEKEFNCLSEKFVHQFEIKKRLAERDAELPAEAGCQIH